MQKNPDNDLSSQSLAGKVFSTLERFTSEFEMVSGSSTPLQLSGNSFYDEKLLFVNSYELDTL